MTSSTLTTIAGYDAQATQILVDWCGTQSIPPSLGLAIGIAETDLNVNAVGDSGASFGVIQVYSAAHGGDATSWTGYDGLRRSLDLMAGRWASAYQGSGADWNRPDGDKAQLFQQLWPAMQGCVQPSLDLCRRAVDEAERLYAAYQAGTTAPADAGAAGDAGQGGTSGADASPDQPAAPTSTIAATVIAPRGLNLRGGPGTDAAILATVPTGAQVQVDLGSWLPVTWNGMTGWMSGQLLAVAGVGQAAVPAGALSSTKVRPLAGRRGYWLRQLSDTAEGAIDRVLDTMTTLGGGDCLCLKVADAMNFQGVIDPATPVNSLDDIVALRDQCHRRGVAFLPVVVPRGIAGEGEFHGAIAAAAGCLMTDIEPYSGFWDGCDCSLIPEYTAALRAAAPNAYLINQPDPREQPCEATCVAATAGDFDAIAAQHYVGWTSMGWTDVAGEVARFTRLAGLGRDMYVTLYGVEQVDLAAAFWAQVQGRCLGLNIFALGPMNADQLRFFAGLPRPGVPPDPLGAPA